MTIKRVFNKRQHEWREIRRQTVLAYLNNDLPRGLCSKLGRQRIEELIKALTCLRREASVGRRSKEEMNRWGKRVKELMSRYPLRKMVWWDEDNGLDFGSDFGNNFRDSKTCKSLEPNTAHSVWALAEVDALDGLFKCGCGKWLFARRRDQKSCSANCRHKRYEQRPEVKANRRQYMREYYRLNLTKP